MALQLAAAWICPDDETDRANLLGAVNEACRRRRREAGDIVEGRERVDDAIEAAARTGMLVVPAIDQVMPRLAQSLELAHRARAEGWRLLLLEHGLDTGAANAEPIVSCLARLIATGAAGLDGPAPPAPLRRRVAGSPGEESFRRSGLMHVECYEAALAAAGVELSQAASVLDWGAGCGRMTSHLGARAPRASLTAVDTDAEAIGWVADNLAVEAFAIGLLPPTRLADDAYDVVIGHSIFSHLAAGTQDRWLAELSRVTRPGGHAVVSFNGPVSLAWHLEHPLADVPRSVERRLQRDGIAFWLGDGWEGEFYDGYHTTFHRHEYVRRQWSQWFDVVAIHERAAIPTQDIAVLRAR
jgi:SAM-dependent methyltransferase